MSDANRATTGSVVIHYLTIPTDPAPTHIPLGISEDDLRMVLDTIAIWRGRIALATGSADSVKHPEEICDDCGGENVTWFAPSPIWNLVCRRPDFPDPMLCPTCFIRRSDKAGQGRSAWKITQEFYDEDPPNTEVTDK